jgi:glutamate synthase (ferredoxin)
MCGVGLLANINGRPSLDILPSALQALARLGHRGAVDADGRTGDGAGVMTEIPHEILGVHPGDAVGVLFGKDRRAFETALTAQRLSLVGYREVPIDISALGSKALSCLPEIVHAIVARPEGMDSDEFERRLNAIRCEDIYIASLSQRTLVYKALVRAVDLAAFYPDLRHPEYATSFTLFHQRFSTNTLPSWSMTQPFRLLAHNGEINTIAGNRSAMRARGFPLAAGTSDSASLDEALAIVTSTGRDLAHGMALLMPPAFERDEAIDPAIRALFEYQASLMEPWDGPAFVVFSDGRLVGAALDRNGLRPARYLLTTDGRLLVASEVGVHDVEERRVLQRGRLGPGGMIAVDLEHGRLLERETIMRELAARHPYEQWLGQSRTTLETGARQRVAADVSTLRAFGYTHDELQLILGPMYKDAAEPLGSMGDDTPLAVLSTRPRLLFAYFKQRFAQVTNPPIDSLRESLVMSLDVRLGPQGDLLSDGPLPPYVELPDPVLDSVDARTLSLLVGVRDDFERTLDALLTASAHAVREGATCLVLSDRGVDCDHAALPSLLAVSAVHHHLIREGLRAATSIVADTGEARDDHQVAALIGFGADAVCPYLAFEVVESLGEEGAAVRYRQTLLKGLLKILSKMGVSTLRSYRGAQLFEAVGIADDVIDRHFTGTPSFIGGIGLEDIARETLARHAAAYGSSALEDAGFYRYRQHGEAHAYNPQVVKALHTAIATNQRIDYKTYAELVHARAPLSLRDLLEFRAGEAIPLEEVEPASSIVRRFLTAAMSLGALSPEAQQVLAMGMNRLGARSNSGEGGEPPELFGTDRANRIKQVASGRFGVTAAYLMSADELQIKIAQGSKPGEGGQLPGHKVTAHIAAVRHAAPGTTLISPPPHHDIYSIEDLAQLVYDLKSVNPAASVSVKLVASAGIGTIAVGVAKAHADAIEISGHDGGTGASPLGSIKNAGTPWELGLAEVQQALMSGGLRGRVHLQVDGGLKTGRDVVIAALLGAEEFGFGTAALVAAGCVMARQCHLNTCPVGIATQREDLRVKFKGTPDDVVRFFTAVAEEVREILALLGFRKFEEIVGRTDLLETRLPKTGKASTLKLDRLCHPERSEGSGRWTGTRIAPSIRQVPRYARDDRPVDITNADRAVGARMAGELVRNPRNVTLSFQGTAGQSFGAFCVEGMRLLLEGEANDYVGKGMSGGEIILRPRAPMPRASEQVIAGNTLLYGATGGRAFIAGRAGERFAVRNSGALAVVEGTGDHACEYMTGGIVVILGSTGRNVAAGMTGGTLFLFDDSRGEALGEADEVLLWELIAQHRELTGSVRAKSLLRKWRTARLLFSRITKGVTIDESRRYRLDADRNGTRADDDARSRILLRRHGAR